MGVENVTGGWRIETRDRLPTRQQIDAIDSIDDLRAMLGTASDGAKAIEVDLDFRSDGDDAWEARARGALTAHRICITNLNRRITFLTRGKGPDQATAQQGKTERKTAAALAQAELAAAQAEHKRAKAEEEREKTVRQIVNMASRQSLLAHFHKVAGDHLDRSTMGALMNMARESLEASLLAELPPLPTGPQAPGDVE